MSHHESFEEWRRRNDQSIRIQRMLRIKPVLMKLSLAQLMTLTVADLFALNSFIRRGRNEDPAGPGVSSDSSLPQWELIEKFERLCGLPVQPRPDLSQEAFSQLV